MNTENDELGKSRAQNAQGLRTTIEKDSSGACLTAMGLELSENFISEGEVKKYHGERGTELRA